MSVHFQSIILLKKSATLAADLLEKAVRDIAGGFVQDLDIPVDGGGQPNLLTFNGVWVAILNIAAPAPGFSDYKSDGPNLLWPTVEADLAKHKAHIIVSCPTQGDGREACLGLASVVTFVTAAILKLTSAIGVYWPAGENFVTSDTFLSAAEDYGRGEGPPVMAWVRLYLHQSVDGTGVCTKGLAPFSGRELEVKPSSHVLGDFLTYVLSVSHYLIQSGAVFKQGETVGSEDAVIFEIKLADTGEFENGAVYILFSPSRGIEKAT